jgi:DNA-binding transcriptional LysR family regulator
MLDQGGLREFVAVVEHGGFTAAATSLDVSTSFVSRQVKRLENRLDTRLLHRTTRAVRLTEMGRVFYERSREILDQLEALESDMADLQERPKGLVRITAPGLYAQRYVAPALARFTARYPDVSIELDTRMGVVDIVTEGYDIAVRMSALADSSLIARKIVKRRIVVCASPAYLAEHGEPKEPEDLRRHNCLTLLDMPWRFAFPNETRVVKVRGSWQCDNGRALVAAAVQGIGLVRFASYYVNEELVSGKLVPVLADYEIQDAATWIIYPDRHHLPTRVRFLIDFLAEHLESSHT